MPLSLRLFGCFGLQGATTGLHGSLLHALQPNRVQPACMKLEPVAQEPGELLSDREAADSVPILQVQYPLLTAWLNSPYAVIHLCHTMMCPGPEPAMQMLQL
jgi:hypothetical protein